MSGGRRVESQKHPAVAIESFERQVDSLNLTRNSKEIPFWDFLNGQQRDVLLLIPRLGSAAVAASYLGLSGEAWVRQQPQEFKDSLEYVAEWKDEIYARRLQELVGVAIIELENTMTTSPNAGARMTAINTLLKVSGRLRESTIQQTVVNGTFVNPEGIQMYEKPEALGAAIEEPVDPIDVDSTPTD